MTPEPNWNDAIRGWNIFKAWSSKAEDEYISDLVSKLEERVYRLVIDKAKKAKITDYLRPAQ